jgi:hypothetical protein
VQRIGPILFFCCENDELSPLETIEIFASNLRNLGGRVDITVWKQSEHVGNDKPLVFACNIVQRRVIACVHCALSSCQSFVYEGFRDSLLLTVYAKTLEKFF